MEQEARTAPLSSIFNPQNGGLRDASGGVGRLIMKRGGGEGSRNQ